MGSGAGLVAGDGIDSAARYGREIVRIRREEASPSAREEFQQCSSECFVGEMRKEA